jgi:hypothetical protein
MFIVLPQGSQLSLGVLTCIAGVVLSVIKLSEKSAPVTTTATTSTLRKKPTDLQLRSLTMNYIIFCLIYILSAVILQLPKC